MSFPEGSTAGPQSQAGISFPKRFYSWFLSPAGISSPPPQKKSSTAGSEARGRWLTICRWHLLNIPPQHKLPSHRKSFINASSTPKGLHAPPKTDDICSYTLYTSRLFVLQRNSIFCLFAISPSP